LRAIHSREIGPGISVWIRIDCSTVLLLKARERPCTVRPSSGTARTLSAHRTIRPVVERIPERYAGGSAALVTGGSSGIGLAIVRDLLEHDVHVSFASRAPGRAGVSSAHPIAVDLADPAAAAAAVDEHMAVHGRLDVLVNAAGLARPERIDAISLDAFDAQIALNVRATVAVCTAALPHLRARRGLIVNVASILGLHGDPALAVYAATKHAVVGYSRSLAGALRQDGVRVTALCPGYVATPFTERALAYVLADEMVQPADCARAVRMLLELSPQTFVPELVLDRLGSVDARLRD
jgi:meso-butanediol dehydrogenase / (S,S)-butanediol dehydrogenase / diacetyl reductase